MDTKTHDTMTELVALAVETHEAMLRTQTRAEALYRELLLRLDAQTERRAP
jgi:hypothetical protein